MIHFQYITTLTQLERIIPTISEEKILSIDLECENNLHHFGAKLSLIQISTSKENFIIDILLTKDVSLLKPIFESQNIQKIFHDVSFDLRILFHELSWHVRNVYDTQLAAKFLAKQKLGLGSLLEEYFKIKKEEKFQRFDWLIRPLPSQVLEYAAKDTLYLLELKKKLEEELQRIGKNEWVIEECKNLENLDWSYHEQTFLDISGVRSLSPIERGRLEVLFTLRQKMAIQADRSAFMIFTNKQLLEFAKNPPTSWKNLSKVHPLVKINSNLFEEAIKNAQAVDFPKQIRHRFSDSEIQKIKDFLEIRKNLAEKLSLAASLLINLDEIHNVVKTKSASQLRSWQKKILEKDLQKLI